MARYYARPVQQDHITLVKSNVYSVLEKGFYLKAMRNLALLIRLHELDSVGKGGATVITNYECRLRGRSDSCK